MINNDCNTKLEELCLKNGNNDEKDNVLLLAGDNNKDEDKNDILEPFPNDNSDADDDDNEDDSDNEKINSLFKTINKTNKMQEEEEEENNNDFLFLSNVKCVLTMLHRNGHVGQPNAAGTPILACLS